MLFQYASARARAEREGLQVVCRMWPGKFLFADCNDPEPDGSEQLIHTGHYDGYCQRQEDIDHYSRSDCKRWFKLHPDVEAALQAGPHHEWLVAHRRAGTEANRDYTNCGYVVPTRESYIKYANGRKWFDTDKLVWVTEETPIHNRMFPDYCAFMPDFYRLMTARLLLRANSTFSWWAATLNTVVYAKVFSPIVTGKLGGQEHDCEFVQGNHPRFCDLPGCSDLYLKEV